VVDLSTSVGYAVSFVTLLIFMRRMLNTQEDHSRFDRFIKLVVGVHLIFPDRVRRLPGDIPKPSALLYLATALLILGTGLFLRLQRSAQRLLLSGSFTVWVIALWRWC